MMPPATLHPRNQSLRQTRDLLRFMLRRLNEERLQDVAGSLTFTTVLAIVPILTIAFALFTTFPLFTTFRDSLEAYFVQSLMPRGVANTILDYLSQFSAKASRLSAVGAIFLLVTAIAMFDIVDRSFNQIWRIQRPRPFVQRMIVYWSIMTLGPLLIGASLTLTTILSPAANSLFQGVPILSKTLSIVFSILLTTLAFTLLYLTVPHRPVDWRDALSGGLAAGVAFEITKYAFTYSITQFPSYRVIYGALAAVPIFLVWIYLCWLITLGGAVLAAALPVVKHERWWHRPTPGTAFLEAVAILRVLVIARETKAAVDALQLREQTRLGFDESETLLQTMLQAGWVGRLGPESSAGRLKFGRRRRWQQDRWALLVNPHKLTLADVYQVFAFAPASQSELAYRVQSVVSEGLATSLADYVVDLEAKRNSASST